MGCPVKDPFGSSSAQTADYGVVPASAEPRRPLPGPGAPLLGHSVSLVLPEAPQTFPRAWSARTTSIVRRPARSVLWCIGLPSASVLCTSGCRQRVWVRTRWPSFFSIPFEFTRGSTGGVGLGGAAFHSSACSTSSCWCSRGCSITHLASHLSGPRPALGFQEALHWRRQMHLRHGCFA